VSIVIRKRSHLALRLILPDPETDSEAEDAEDLPPPPMIMGTADTTNDLLPHLEIFLDRVVTMIILFPHFSIGN
jgi:hypothetical protein